MKNRFWAAALAVLSSCALVAPAFASDNFPVKDANGTTITKASKQLTDLSQADKNILIDANGLPIATSTNPIYVTFPTTPSVSITNTTIGISGTLPAFAATPTFNIGTAPALSITSSALPTGAATAAAQATNTSAITATQAAPGSSATTAQGVQGVTGGLPIDTVVKSTATDRGAVVGTTAITLMAANTARRGFSVQVQSSTASCYISGSATATADYHSLLIGPLQLYETSPQHVGTGAISIICSAASVSVYAREY